MATTAQQIVNATAQDVQAQLGPEHPALLDYCNRVCLELMKTSRWKFLLSAPQRFLTIEGQTDYWFGPTGTGPNYVADTGLNLTNLELIKPASVFDRSNWRTLLRTDSEPNLPKMAYQDGLMRVDRPKLWKYGPENPNILSLYPAADNQNGYAPVPPAPVLTTVAGGTLAARTETYQVTFVDSAGGESLAGNAASIFVPANRLAVVGPPQPGIAQNDRGVQYNQYNVYGALAGSTLLKQNASPVATTAAWPEPASGLATGGSMPTSSTLAPVGGYVIEFRYYQTRLQVTTLTQTLQIPDLYKDVVVAGVNAKAFALMGSQFAPNYAFWLSQYEEGIRGIIRDANLFPRGGEYIRPDAASLTRTLPAIETLDPSLNQV